MFHLLSLIQQQFSSHTFAVPSTELLSGAASAKDKFLTDYFILIVVIQGGTQNLLMKLLY